MPVKARDGYRVRKIVLGQHEEAIAEGILQMLKREGWTRANRSYVMRAGVACLSDALRGKSPDEFVRFFIFIERLMRQRPA